MMVMERRCGYGDILAAAKGKRVLIWTCNTCARLCNNLGGDASASELASRLKADGVDVIGVLSTSASCLKSKVRSKSESLDAVPELIISMTCDIGARCVRDVFGTSVFEPFETLGPGYLDEGGVPRLSDGN